MLSSSEPARRGVSKREFLTGAVAGACLLQGGRWIAQATAKPPAEDPDDRPELSYAQAGEDLIVGNLFGSLGLPQPTYIDVGAYDPIKINNTYLFYTRGCRGVLVEPNPDMAPRLKGKRPQDTVLTAGIGVTNETHADYYLISDPSWNTFDKETAEHYEKVTEKRVYIKEVIKMPLLNINDVFAQHFGGGTPDYVSLDVEGFEVPILKSMNFDKHRPKVICIETLVAGTAKQKLEGVEFLAAKGYVVRGQTFANTILVDQKLVG